MNTGAWSFENIFTLNFFGQEWIFSMVVNLVHDSMFSIFVFMVLQEKGFSQSPCCVEQASQLFWRGNGA